MRALLAEELPGATRGREKRTKGGNGERASALRSSTSTTRSPLCTRARSPEISTLALVALGLAQGAAGCLGYGRPQRGAHPCAVVPPRLDPEDLLTLVNREPGLVANKSRQFVYLTLNRALSFALRPDPGEQGPRPASRARGRLPRAKYGTKVRANGVALTSLRAVCRYKAAPKIELSTPSP